MLASYGAVGNDRKIVSPSSRRMVLYVAGVVLSVALSSFAYISALRKNSLLEKINGLELNAYLSASQVEQFHNLVSKQTEISAGIAGLLEREREMKPEDTKVTKTIFVC